MKKILICILHFLSNIYCLTIGKCVEIDQNSYLWRTKIKTNKGNKIIIGRNSKLINCNINVKGTGNNIYIGDNVYLYKLSLNILSGDNNSIKIFNNCFLTDNSIFIDTNSNHNELSINENVRAKELTYWIEDNHNHINIGASSTFEDKCQLAACEGKSIMIGNECMFAHDILVRTTDSHSLYQNGVRYNYAKDISVGDHCWIGLQSLILKGSNIPAGCIVAARSVVTGSTFEENSIIGGSPAKTIRTSVEWTRERNDTFHQNVYIRH